MSIHAGLSVFQKRCARCHELRDAYKYIIEGSSKRICHICREKEHKQNILDRRNARRRERTALAREIKLEAKYKARILTQPLNKLKHTVERINTILHTAGIELIEMPPAVTTAREVVYQNKVMRKILSEYLRLTRLNRNRLRQMTYKASPSDITRASIQRRQHMQQMASEALKMSLVEFISGDPYHDVHTHYGDLMTIYRAI